MQLATDNPQAWLVFLQLSEYMRWTRCRLSLRSYIDGQQLVWKKNCSNRTKKKIEKSVLYLNENCSRVGTELYFLRENVINLRRNTVTSNVIVFCLYLMNSPFAHILHYIAPCSPLKFLHNHCLRFLMGRLQYPVEIGKKCFCGFFWGGGGEGGGYIMHGLCEKGKQNSAKSHKDRFVCYFEVVQLVG